MILENLVKMNFLSQNGRILLQPSFLLIMKVYNVKDRTSKNLMFRFFSGKIETKGHSDIVRKLKTLSMRSNFHKNRFFFGFFEVEKK